MRFPAIAAAFGLAGALLVLAPPTPSSADEKPAPRGSTAEVPSEDDAALDGPRQPHPLYDDHGALDWRKQLAQSQKLAKARRKLIFIEYGRET